MFKEAQNAHKNENEEEDERKKSTKLGDNINKRWPFPFANYLSRIITPSPLPPQLAVDRFVCNVIGAICTSEVRIAYVYTYRNTISTVRRRRRRRKFK